MRLRDVIPPRRPSIFTRKLRRTYRAMETSSVEDFRDEVEEKRGRASAYLTSRRRRGRPNVPLRFPLFPFCLSYFYDASVPIGPGPRFEALTSRAI